MNIQTQKNSQLIPSTQTDLEITRNNPGTCLYAAQIIKEAKLLERIESSKQQFDQTGKIRTSGLRTNFKQLDDITDGLQAGHLIVLAGRTGMGKTHVALNILKNIVIDQQIPAAFFSLEMTYEQLFYRLISLCTNIPSVRIKRGIIDEIELQQIRQAILKIENSPLYISDNTSNCFLGNLTLNIQNACTGMHSGNKVKLVIIDHIGLIKTKQNFHDNRVNEVGEITRALKIIAKDYTVPILALAQLNRNADKDELPKLSELRESGAIEQDSDIVLFLHRSDYYNAQKKPHEATILIAKNRDGEQNKAIDFTYNETWLLKEVSQDNIQSEHTAVNKPLHDKVVRERKK